MANQLYVSYSSMTAFRNCPRFYFYRHIKRYQLRSFNIPYLVGRVMHTAIQALLNQPKTAEKILQEKYQQEKKQARKDFPTMSVRDEEELIAQEAITLGILRAFKKRYSQFLSATKHIATEKLLIYPLNKQVMVVAKLDNVVFNQNQYYLYELKNLKSLDMERVETIRTDPQTSLYFKIHNLVEKKFKLGGILYNIVRKPSIRQKQKETRGEFLNRLSDWYEDDAEYKFHLERLKKPFVSGDAVMNTVTKITDRMLNCKSVHDYYQDFNFCIHEWGKCEFYALCHRGGETKENMKLIQIRPRYQVNNDETGKDGGEAND